MPKKLDIISQAELARRLDITQSAVHNAVKNKRITLRTDGKINYPVALAEWKANTDPARAKVQIDGSTKPEKPKPPKLDAQALTDIMKLLEGEGFDTTGGLTHELIRSAEGLARANERIFDLAIKRKEYIPLKPAAEHTRNIFIGFKKMMLNIPARTADIIAAKLGCDAFLLEQEMSRVIRETLDEMAAPVVRG